MRHQLISIHAPRAGSDRREPASRVGDGISIHAPRAGSDSLGRLPDGNREHFNPRSPCGERLGGFEGDAGGIDFNPRSPCGERRALAGIRMTHTGFQSTLPVRGATRALDDVQAGFVISIHAPRAGSDIARCLRHADAGYFNPRSPCGERRVKDILISPISRQISIHAPRAGSDNATGI